MLSPCPIPGLFITATDTSVGKTLIAAAIASHLKSLGQKIAVCKPIATGCTPAPSPDTLQHFSFIPQTDADPNLTPSPGTPGEGGGEGLDEIRNSKSEIRNNPHPNPPPEYQGREQELDLLISDDAAFLAHHAGVDFPLDIINPVRYRDPLAPAVAAGRENRLIDWRKIDSAIAAMSQTSDAIIVEGIGGVLVPLDSQYTLLDMIKWLKLPAVVVARASLGTINHTLLTLQALRSANIPIAGVVINRFPAHPDLAGQTNPAAIAEFGRTKILACLPETASPLLPHLPPEILGPLSQVDWLWLMAQAR